MNESPIVLACEDVTLGYEHKPLLEHLTLTVRAGDYLCIVGENGSGKSTLLRSLLGLLSPLAGKIDCPAQREGRLGYLPQQTPTQRDFPATVTEVVLSGFSNRRARFFYTAEERSTALMNLGKLGVLDPANEDFYRANCDDYCAQIEALDARFASLCESAPHKLLVFADRFPMLYFCREFGLDYRAAFHGCSGDTEPSLATIKFLIDKVENENIPVVYTIDFGTKKVAAVVSECTGAAVDTLYSMQTVSRADFDAGETYLTLMERNYEALRKGLNE